MHKGPHRRTRTIGSISPKNVSTGDANIQPWNICFAVLLGSCCELTPILLLTESKVTVSYHLLSNLWRGFSIMAVLKISCFHYCKSTKASWKARKQNRQQQGSSPKVESPSPPPPAINTMPNFQFINNHDLSINISQFYSHNADCIQFRKLPAFVCLCTQPWYIVWSFEQLGALVMRCAKARPSTNSTTLLNCLYYLQFFNLTKLTVQIRVF